MTGRRRTIPVPLPLAVWERDGLAAALAKAGLPADDICAAGPMFWRFESDDVPVGFGGLEIFDDQALLRSVVTLPPVRNRGIGTAIVASLEAEASIRGCRAAWLVTEKAAGFFARLGYRACERSEAPKPVREAAPFVHPAAAAAMTKQLV
ncbi:MAG TPA: GNAT family N-acetyltransferase [Xanthobacteraceae bacterium]|nr:GNAT family N-acetyltransferase [Xanthobacteraceae bacterium]